MRMEELGTAYGCETDKEPDRRTKRYSVPWKTHWKPPVGIMSRSGYDDDCDGWQLIMWRGAVASAIRGKRGQAFLREMFAALDGLPDKRLIEGELLEVSGEVCALGAVGVKRGVDMAEIDPYDRKTVAGTFAIPQALAAEIMDINDSGWRFTPEQRWARVREWTASQLKPE